MSNYRIEYKDKNGKGFSDTESWIDNDINNREELLSRIALLKNMGCKDIKVIYDDDWNVILNTIEGQKVIPSNNNPSNSGQYLCTCITKNGEYEHRYLRIMEYNADKNYWHDIGNESGISHVILAWKVQNVCGFDDFEYQAGVLFEKK